MRSAIRHPDRRGRARGRGQRHAVGHRDCGGGDPAVRLGQRYDQTGAAGPTITAPFAGAGQRRYGGHRHRHHGQPARRGGQRPTVSTTGTLTNTPPGGVAAAGTVAVTTQVTGSLSVTAPLVGAGITVAVSDAGS